MNKHLQFFATIILFSLTLASPQLSYGSYEDSFPFENLPPGVRGMILKRFAADSIAEGKSFGEVAPVSKKWKAELREFVKQDLEPWQPCWKAYLGVKPVNKQT